MGIGHGGKERGRNKLLTDLWPCLIIWGDNKRWGGRWASEGSGSGTLAGAAPPQSAGGAAMVSGQPRELARADRCQRTPTKEATGCRTGRKHDLTASQLPNLPSWCSRGPSRRDRRPSECQGVSHYGAVIGGRGGGVAAQLPASSEAWRVERRNGHATARHGLIPVPDCR